jgi:hypothetical protein
MGRYAFDAVEHSLQALQMFLGGGVARGSSGASRPAMR